MATPKERLAPVRQAAQVTVQGPRVVVKAPPVKIPEIKLPTINVPPPDLRPIVGVLNSLVAAVSELRATVVSQQETMQTLAKRLSNMKITVPPRARTYEVEIDDGKGGKRIMRVRAGDTGR